MESSENPSNSGSNQAETALANEETKIPGITNDATIQTEQKKGSIAKP